MKKKLIQIYEGFVGSDRMYSKQLYKQIQIKQQMDLQTLHVSQLYESVATFGVLVLLIAEIIAFWRGFTLQAQQVRLEEQEEESIWMNQHSKSKNSQSVAPDRQPDLEKSAIQSLRRQMNQYENKAVQVQEVQVTDNQPSMMASRLPGVSQANRCSPPEEVPKKLQGNLSNSAQIQRSLRSKLLFYIEYNNLMKEHVSIIFSVLVIGMLSNSTRIFSLACFFCYLFTSLTFDFLQLEERLKKEYKRGIVLRRIIKIISNCLILGLFISYWCIGQYVQYV